MPEWGWVERLVISVDWRVVGAIVATAVATTLGNLWVSARRWEWERKQRRLEYRRTRVEAKVTPVDEWIKEVMGAAESIDNVRAMGFLAYDGRFAKEPAIVLSLYREIDQRMEVVESLTGELWASFTVYAPEELVTDVAQYKRAAEALKKKLFEFAADVHAIVKEGRTATDSEAAALIKQELQLLEESYRLLADGRGLRKRIDSLLEELTERE